MANRSPNTVNSLSRVSAVLRLIAHRLSIRAHMDLQWFLRDFRVCIFDMVGDMICTLAAVSGLYLLAERFGVLGGFTKQQVLFMLGFGLSVEGLGRFLFGGENTGMPSRRLGRGQLDHMMIQPAPLWVQMLTDGFAPVTYNLQLIAGLAVVFLCAQPAGYTLTPLFILLLFFEMLSAALLIMAFQFLCAVPALYAQVAAEEVSTTVESFFTSLRMFPLGGLSNGVKVLLCTLLPVGLVAWLPSLALLDAALPLLFLPLIMAALFGTAAALLMRRAIDHYKRVGAIRYSPRGFR